MLRYAMVCIRRFSTLILTPVSIWAPILQKQEKEKEQQQERGRGQKQKCYIHTAERKQLS